MFHNVRKGGKSASNRPEKKRLALFVFGCENRKGETVGKGWKYNYRVLCRKYEMFISVYVFNIISNLRVRVELASYVREIVNTKPCVHRTPVKC